MRPVRYIEGFSESLWKSLLVKSIRLGWPAGIMEAELRLSPSVVKGIAVCQIFEDIFPSEEEVPGILKEIEAKDWVALCKRDTHHGRALTENYGRFEKKAVFMSKNQGAQIYDHARRLGIPYLPPRAVAEFAIWTLTLPQIEHPTQRRTLDISPYRGLPKAMADMHTVEAGGMKAKVETLLSGNVGGHMKLQRTVERGGWELARQQVHEDPVLQPKPTAAKATRVAQATLALF